MLALLHSARRGAFATARGGECISAGKFRNMAIPARYVCMYTSGCDTVALLYVMLGTRSFDCMSMYLRAYPRTSLVAWSSTLRVLSWTLRTGPPFRAPLLS